MSVALARVRDMKKLQDAVAVIGFSIGALLYFRLPSVTSSNNLDSILQYSLMGLAFLYFIHTYQLPTLKYFRMPELSISSLAGLSVVVFYSYSGIISDRAITLPFIPTITGLVYLFAIGAGEELVSRGFVFGVLRKYGATSALIFSSIIFGLMHLNVYTGDDWNAYHAYWHCLSAMGFGFLAGVVMIVTRSILSAIVMHALFDWSVAFSKNVESGPSDYVEHFDPLWETIKASLEHISMDVVTGLFLLAIFGIAKIRWFPKFLKPVLLKFGLVEEL